MLGCDPWHDAVDLHHRLVYVPGSEIMAKLDRRRGD